MRTVLGTGLVLVALAAANVTCGGKVVVDASPSVDSGTTCTAATSACDLPGETTPDDACTACVEQSICACKDLNPPADWSLPTSCDAEGATCTASDHSTAACKIAAVGFVRCMLHRTHEECQSAYFAHSPAANDPFGMDFGLFGCAVCSTCASACANVAPDFQSVCCATNPSMPGCP